jgi:hypothetical protein
MMTHCSDPRDAIELLYLREQMRDCGSKSPYARACGCEAADISRAPELDEVHGLFHPRTIRKISLAKVLKSPKATRPLRAS